MADKFTVGTPNTLEKVWNIDVEREYRKLSCLFQNPERNNGIITESLRQLKMFIHQQSTTIITSGLICYSSHPPPPAPYLCLKRHSNKPNSSTQEKVEQDEKCELERCQLLLFFFDRQIHQRHQQTTSTDKRRVRHARYLFLSSYTVQINKSNTLRKVI